MTRALYYASFAVGLGFAVLVNRRLVIRRREDKKDAVLYTVLGFLAGVIGAILMSFIYNWVLGLVSEGEQYYLSNVSIYGGLLLLPAVMPFFTLPAGRSYGSVMDVCTPGVYMLLSFGKIGCSVYGCCYGIESAWGVRNPFTGQVHFPVQLLESAFTLLLVFVLYRYALNEKRAKNTVYPLGLALYAFGRFFFQFLRFHEVAAEENLVGFMDFWQTVSLIAFLGSVCWLLIAYLNQNNKFLRRKL